jgi:hypothetical protein
LEAARQLVTGFLAERKEERPTAVVVKMTGDRKNYGLADLLAMRPEWVASSRA